MDILKGEFRCRWIVHWQSKALQKLLSNQHISLLSCHASELVTILIPSKKVK